jgi:hypothetical protein
MTLDHPHVPISEWSRRQSLNKIKEQRPMFEQLMQQTSQCMKQHPELHNDVEGAIQCETIHPQTLSNFIDYTFHTHPHGDIDYPSEQDIKTTTKLKKDFLVIGLPSKDRVVVYHKDDNFQEKIAEF